MKRITSIVISMSLITSPAFSQEPEANSKSLSQTQRQKFAKANPEDITDENFPETIESFDFPNVDITDVIKAISELTGKNFIIDPGVRGKITIIAPSKITVAEAYKAFLSALAINGFTVVPSGNFLKVKLARNAQRDSIETYSGTYYPNTDQLITRIINLKHIQAEQVTRELTILQSNNGEMRAYPPTNSIIISDYGSNIDRVMKILAQLDVPGFEDKLEVIQIKYGKAKDLAELVDRIVNKGQQSNNNRGGTFSSGVARFSRVGGQGSAGSFFMAIPDDRTNSIVITGSQSGIQRVKKLIAQLDFRIRAEDSGGVHVYYVMHGDAEKIAQTLQNVTKEGAPKPTTGPSPVPSPFSPITGQPAVSTEIFGGDVKISADKNTNSLVIMASKQDYDTVKALLAKLDIPRNQVFVEAIIMEMKASLDDKWQIGYYKFGDGGIGKSGFNSGINLGEMLNPAGGTGTIIGFGQGETINATDPASGKSYSVKSLTGFINFLKTAAKANILSRPTITVIDNQDGEIEVGEKVPTSINVTQGTATSGAMSSPVMEDATLKLKIKPFISPATNAIRMEVDQEIKQPTTVQGLPDVLAQNTKPLAKRRVKTMIVVNDGDTAILGGLMRDQDDETVQKVPLLGDLPIIGWLFKGRTATRSKTNLTVFLTPKIIKTPGVQKAIISQKLDQRLEFVKAQGGKDPYGSTVDEISSKLSAAPDDKVENQPKQ